MRRIYAFFRAGLAFIGFLSVLFIYASVGGVFQKAADFLSTARYTQNADYIVLLPGAGIPSGATMVRAYHAAAESRKNPSAYVIISHKVDGPLEESTGWAIRKELLLRSVPESKILLETKARNTHEHAKYILSASIGDPLTDKYLIVTSPTHIRRAVMAFTSEGFKNVYARSAEPAGGKEDLGKRSSIRYEIWGGMHLGLNVIREFIAIAYYKVSGWA
ncbi:hypothetical protein MNBD_NITROSPINAE01-546 [hydrothermal vent metagenome]|uniref:DUF218 domain-containing protein n=1 Tax=hydrothermal vent metagenome TaxID=652676 RepID=A0A3B1CXG2_9ZZZZ